MSKVEPTPLLIFPYNGNGLEALHCLGSAYRLAGFVDDTPEKQGADAYGHRVFDRTALASMPETSVLAVPGSATSFRQRAEVIGKLGVDPARLATVIHPAANVSPLAKIGKNVLIMAGVVVTSNAAIGDHVCVLPNTVIHHDVVIEAWTLIGANVTIAGGVHVGPNCYIGSGTRIMNGRSVGEGALIGLGSNVIRDVATHSTVAGNPARRLPPK